MTSTDVVVGSKDCVRIHKGGATWKDTDCSSRFGFICMKGGSLELVIIVNILVRNKED